jgi:3-oxoacyl-[acyl-carrier-protein] synthase-3
MAGLWVRARYTDAATAARSATREGLPSMTSQPSKTPLPMPPTLMPKGVRIAGTGMYVPKRVVTNHDLATLVDTSDEWIRQRTGIVERRKADWDNGETTSVVCAGALRDACADANISPSQLDMIIVGTVTGEMACPSTACRVAHALGAAPAAAYDVLAACCGFVFGLNQAHDFIRAGSYKTIGVVGGEILSSMIDYTDRNVCILFGDGAGAAVIQATDDTSKGIIAQSMHADGASWRDLYQPRRYSDLPEGVDPSTIKLNMLQMNGREVYKFAVKTFSMLIEETLDKAGLTPEQIDHFVCHQSNARILESASERFGIPPERLYVNIDRYGNCSAGSVPICLHELRSMGRIKEDQLVMFLAFGAGVTWGSSLWRV